MIIPYISNGIAIIPSTTIMMISETVGVIAV